MHRPDVRYGMLEVTPALDMAMSNVAVASSAFV